MRIGIVGGTGAVGLAFATQIAANAKTMVSNVTVFARSQSSRESLQHHGLRLKLEGKMIAVPVDGDNVVVRQLSGYTGSSFDVVFLCVKGDVPVILDYPAKPDLGQRPCSLTVIHSNFGCLTCVQQHRRPRPGRRKAPEGAGTPPHPRHGAGLCAERPSVLVHGRLRRGPRVKALCFDVPCRCRRLPEGANPGGRVRPVSRGMAGRRRDRGSDRRDGEACQESDLR